MSCGMTGRTAVNAFAVCFGLLGACAAARPAVAPSPPAASGVSRAPDAADAGAPGSAPRPPTLTPLTAEELDALRPLLARGPAFVVRNPDGGAQARITLVQRSRAPLAQLHHVVSTPAEYTTFMPILRSVEVLSEHGPRTAFRFHVAAPLFDVTALCNLHAVSPRRVDVNITESEAGPAGSRWDLSPDGDGSLLSMSTWGDPSQGHWLLRQVARRSPTSIAGMNIAAGSVLGLGAARRAEILAGLATEVRPAQGVADAGELAPPPPGPWMALARDASVVSMQLTPEGAVRQVTVAAWTPVGAEPILARLRAVEGYTRVWGSFREVEVLPREADDPEGSVRFRSRVETPLTRLQGIQRLRVSGNTVWHDGLTGEFAGGGHRWDIVEGVAGGTVVLLTGGSDLQRAGWITRAMISMDPWLAVGFAGSWKIVWLRNFLRAV